MNIERWMTNYMRGVRRAPLPSPLPPHLPYGRQRARSLSLSLSTFFRGTPVKASTLQWAGQHRQGKGRSRQARRAGAPSLVSSAPSPSPSHGTHLALLDPSFPMAVQYTARYALAIILGSLASMLRSLGLL